MHNFTNPNTSNRAESEGRSLRAALKNASSWAHEEKVDYLDRKEIVSKEIEIENNKVLALLKSINEINKDIKILRDEKLIEIKKKILSSLDFQKFITIKKRNELAKELSIEDRKELGEKLGTDLSLEII